MSVSVRHIAGIAEIVEDMEAAVRFYRDVLGLKVSHEPGAGYAVVDVPGVLHFGLWLRSAAAQAVFGDAKAANRIPLGFTLGFEVDSVNGASQQMKALGWPIAQMPKREDWGQTTSRFFAPSGALCEVCESPQARQITHNVQA